MRAWVVTGASGFQMSLRPRFTVSNTRMSTPASARVWPVSSRAFPLGSTTMRSAPAPICSRFGRTKPVVLPAPVPPITTTLRLASLFLTPGPPP